MFLLTTENVPTIMINNLLYIKLAALSALLLFLPVAIAAQESTPFQNVLEQATEAGIDTGYLESLSSRAENRGLSPEEFSSLMNPAISLAENDLPYHPVLRKSMEGMAKNIPAGNIRQVIDNMANGLMHSAEIVDPVLERKEVHVMMQATHRDGVRGPSTGEFRNMILENTSYALQQGMDEHHLRNFLDDAISENIARRSGWTSIASAVRAYAGMPTSEEQPETTNQLLLRALNSGFSEQEIRQLPDAFRSAQFHSQLPVDNIARGLDQQMRQGIPPNHVLDNMFRGNVGGGPPGFTPPGLDGRGDDDDRGRGRGRGPGNRPNGPPGQ